jgi:hypothetical protein
VKGLSGSIFDQSPSQLLLTIYESIGLWGLTNPFVTCEMSSRPTSEGAATHFSLTVYESLGALLGCRIHSPPMKEISRALLEWAATRFCLTVYESTVAVRADESICHL